MATPFAQRQPQRQLDLRLPRRARRPALLPRPLRAGDGAPLRGDHRRLPQRLPPPPQPGRGHLLPPLHTAAALLPLAQPTLGRPRSLPRPGATGQAAAGSRLAHPGRVRRDCSTRLARPCDAAPASPNETGSSCSRSSRQGSVARSCSRSTGATSSSTATAPRCSCAAAREASPAASRYRQRSQTSSAASRRRVVPQAAIPCSAAWPASDSPRRSSPP